MFTIPKHISGAVKRAKHIKRQILCVNKEVKTLWLKAEHGECAMVGEGKVGVRP